MSELIDRREALRRVTLLMGGALSAPAALAVLSGCAPKKEQALGWRPVFFTAPQAGIITEIVEIMIPRTDTPGAKDVGVPAFIDSTLKAVYAPQDQQRFIAGLEQFEAKSQSGHGRSFLEIKPAERVALVQSIHNAAIEEERLSPDRSDRSFILMTKELALLGYFTSEAGATQVLQYLPVPGPFHGCVPLSQAGNGKTWAVETSRPF